MEKDEITNLQKRIGYNFKDIELLKKAITHKSFDRKNNYERLEILGDGLLGVIITEFLYNHTPHLDQGLITDNKCSIVNNKYLAIIARRLGLNKIMLCSQGARSELIKHPAHKIYADCVEAIIGAIYLDGGLDSAREFVLGRLLQGYKIKQEREHKRMTPGKERRIIASERFARMRNAA